MKQDRSVLIVGAGPTGMTAAMELSRFGVPVRIVDKLATPPDTSQALAVQARTLELFSQRDLTDEMLRLGNRGNATTIYGNGKQLGKVEFQRIESPFNYILLLAQNETERIVREQLTRQGVTIERPTELIAFSQPDSTTHADDDAFVVAALRNGAGEVEELQAAYMVCAEGSHSIVRRTLDLEFKGKSLEQAYALADLHLEGALPDDELSIFLTAKGLLAVFPLGNRRFRLIATDPEHHQNNAEDPSLGELQGLYNADCHIPAKLYDMTWSSRFRINSRMLGTLRERRIFFGGDAAHIHSPAGGQGMNTGIQDMINLGWKLAMVYHGQAGPELLDTYSAERLPVIQEVVSKTEAATDAFNSTNPIVYQLMTHVAPALLNFGAVQEKGTNVISELNTQYRSSALSEGKHAVGSLRAGDRLPYVNVTTGNEASEVSIYDLLNPSAFTVFICGAKGNRQADPTSLKSTIVEVRRISPGDSNDDAAAFKKAFGENASLVAVRPDAYVGFIGAVTAETDLKDWFDNHFKG